MVRKVKRKGVKNKKTIFLIVQGTRNALYAAKDGRRVSNTELASMIKSYKPKRGDGVTKSQSAFIVMGSTQLERAYGRIFVNLVKPPHDRSN